MGGYSTKSRWLDDGTSLSPKRTNAQISTAGITLSGDLDMGANDILQTDSIFGSTSILPVRIGDAGTTSHSLNSEDDLLVTGKLEVDGTLFLDSNVAIATGPMDLADNVQLRFGSGPNAAIQYNIMQATDTLAIGLSTDSRTLLIHELVDGGYNFAFPQQTNPTICLHSANQSTTEWLGLTHDQTDAVISSGAGDIKFSPAGGDINFNTANLINGGSITGSTLTDGTASITSGAVSGVTTLGASSTVTVTPSSAVTGIFVNQDNDAKGIEIDTEATSSSALYIRAVSSTTPTVDIATINNSREVMILRQEGTGNASASVLWMQDTTSTNPSIFLDKDGNGIGLKIDSESTTYAPIVTESVAISTNFERHLKIGALTIWISDGTTAEGALTGVAGDICLNGGTGAGQTAYCDANGTNWTDM